MKISVFLCLLFLVIFSGNNRDENFNKTSYNEQGGLFHPELVKNFYLQNQNKLFWFTGTQNGKDLRQHLINFIDTGAKYGWLTQGFHATRLKEIFSIEYTDSTILSQSDRVYTDAAFACMKEYFVGGRMEPWPRYDEFSNKTVDREDKRLVDLLSGVKSAPSLVVTINSLEPREPGVKLLKQELKSQFEKKDKNKIRDLKLSLNYFRWIHHFNFKKFIVVNIPSAMLRYYEYDSLKLLMKVIVGKPSTRTPRFAAYCDQVILYPYWNVPRSITMNELLPVFKKKPSAIDAMNMQVVNSNGKVVNHYTLNWASFNSSYFPYSLRQSTGCDNALGVIKFNIKSPFSVYLHDTNNKKAFLSANRYYSHGCIRLEKPIELGNYLLHNRLDTGFLQSCVRNQKPLPLTIEEPVPVFVVYMPAEETRGNIKFYKDVYHLF